MSTLFPIADMTKFESAWSGSPFYVGKNGKGGINDRYARFKKYLETGKDIYAPLVYVRDSGVIDFSNGRHRYAVMRDLSLPIKVAIYNETIDNAKKYGYI